MRTWRVPVTMSELPGRVRRAFRDHDAFEQAGDRRFRATSTLFDADVVAEADDDGRVTFAVTVRVPMLDAVTEDEVADVVEEGWYETFRLRVTDVGAVTERDRELSPTVNDAGDEAVVAASLSDIDERRGVNDAAALIDFVEGTFVQGVIPGYDYTDPVASILAEARQAGGSDPV